MAPSPLMPLAYVIHAPGSEMLVKVLPVVTNPCQPPPVMLFQ